MKNTLKYFGLVVWFFSMGYLVGASFFKISIAQIVNENTNIINQTLKGQSYAFLLIALSLGSTPLLYLLLKKLCNLKFKYQGIISIGLITACGIILWMMRIIQLRALSTNKYTDGIQNGLMFENLHFEKNLFLGFLVGTFISIMVFGKRNDAGLE